MVKSNYEILGVPEGASRNEIRSAFRNLALTHHADRGGQDEEFIIIKQAFEDLKSGKKFPDSLDEKKRRSKFFGVQTKKSVFVKIHYCLMMLQEKLKLRKNGLMH